MAEEDDFEILKSPDSSTVCGSTPSTLSPTTSSPIEILPPPLVALRPGCYQFHRFGKGKGKGKARRESEVLCGMNTPQCFTSVIVDTLTGEPVHDGAHPSNAIPLSAADQLAELSSWLMRPYLPSTANADRNNPARLNFRPYHPWLADSAIHYEVLLQTLAAAYAERTYLQTQVLSFRDHLARRPYNISIQGRDIELAEDAAAAEESTSPPPPGELEPKERAYWLTSTRRLLTRHIFTVASEVDHLRQTQDKLARALLDAKVAAAKRGDWTEIQDLLRSGRIDLDWVVKYCRL